MANPYRIGPPVANRDFYGRSLLIEKLLNSGETLIWLMGNRRVGKSSLLQQLQTRANDSGRFIAVYLDFAVTETLDDWAECLYYATEADSVINALEQAEIDISDCHDLNFFQLLQALAEKCDQKGRKLLMLGDEVEAWIKVAERDPNFTQKLRYWWGRSANKLKIIITATKLLLLLNRHENYNSPLLTHFSPYYIAQIEDREANELIKQTQQKNPHEQVNVSSVVMKKIKDYTGNHPFLIQKVCRDLFEEDSRSLRDFGKDDLVVDLLLDSCFKNDYDSLSIDESRLLQKIARYGKVNKTELMKHIDDLNEPGKLSTYLFTLERLGFVKKFDRPATKNQRNSGGFFSISNYLLWKWLQMSTPSPSSVSIDIIPDEGSLTANLESLHRRLNTHTANLNKLKEDAALYGSGGVPLRLHNLIKTEEETIEELKTQITTLEMKSSTYP